MNIKVVITRDYKYNEEKELNRLKSCFKGKVLQRQMDIYNAFLAKDLDKVVELYHKLPYNSKEGCPEQEFVGNWFSILFGGWGEFDDLVSSKRDIEYIM